MKERKSLHQTFLNEDRKSPSVFLIYDLVAMFTRGFARKGAFYTSERIDKRRASPLQRSPFNHIPLTDSTL